MTAARSPRGLRGLSTEARGMLPWCLGLSAAVHVLLLASVASSAPRAASLAHAGRRSAGPISVRLVAADATARSEAAETVSSSQAAPDPQTAPTPASAPRSASAPRLATEPTESGSSAADARSMAGDPADDGYLPRPLLTVAPRADAPVVIPVPPGPVEVGQRVGVLVLYIDEQGRVRRIEAEPPLLPPAMERAAREAFAAARFSPGEVGGQVVKSRIRVEVTFDAESLPAASARAASGASAARAASGASAASAARAASGASGARPASDQRSR
jgi:hypothetical protein